MSDVLYVSLYCSGCKRTVKSLIDVADNAKSWAVNLSSPAMRQAICTYCESKKRVRLKVEIAKVLA